MIPPILSYLRRGKDASVRGNGGGRALSGPQDLVRNPQRKTLKRNEIRLNVFMSYL
jgi:hypothetical protein